MRHTRTHSVCAAGVAVTVTLTSTAFAVEPTAPAADPGQYVLYFLLVGGLLAFFGATVLFPSTRRKRQSLRQRLAERLPFLPSAQDRRHAARMDELRGLKGDIDREDRPGVIEIQPRDFGRMALSSEQTVDASFSEMPALEEILGRAEAQANRANRYTSTSETVDEVAMTHEALPLPVVRTVRADLDLSGEDDIPFDLLDPTLKPQLRSSKYDDEATAVRDAEVRSVLRDAPLPPSHRVRGVADVDQTVAASIRPIGTRRDLPSDVAVDLIDTLEGE